MFVFSERTKDILIKSGWREGRKIPYLKYLKYRICIYNEGYHFSRAVKDFITEFGGLKLEYQRENFFFDSLHFKVCKSINDVHSGWFSIIMYTDFQKTAFILLDRDFQTIRYLIETLDILYYVNDLF